MQTSRTYYELMDVSDASEAHASLQSLSMLRRWSQHEIRQITDMWPLSSDNPPSNRECKEFIKTSGLNRTTKEIIFKWQHLKNYTSIPVNDSSYTIHN